MTVMGVIIITTIQRVLCALDMYYSVYNPTRIGVTYPVAQGRKMVFIEKVSNSSKITQSAGNWARWWAFHSV